MTSPCPITPLSFAYTAFVLFETVMINGVGFLTLCFQRPLQRAARAYRARRPERAAWEVDPLFGLFWTEADATDRLGHLLHLVIAGWLGIAGALQASIHFLPGVPDELKRVCLLVFFACDLFWIGLMASFGDAFKWTHVYGSIFTIACRVPFVVAPALMYHESVIPSLWASASAE